MPAVIENNMNFKDIKVENSMPKTDPDPDPENKFLASVYLQKSPYVIKGNLVEHIEN
jgi:hypothetical protein